MMYNVIFEVKEKTSILGETFEPDEDYVLHVEAPNPGEAKKDALRTLTQKYLIKDPKIKEIL